MIIQPDWQAIEQAILEQNGELLLRFMRDVFFNRANPSTDLKIISLAIHLGWIEDDYNKWQLTPHGALIADSAREYCNWIDEKRQLPYGVNEADIEGKSILDLGCGFGRYVLSASRIASLAVGLEAEQTYLKMSSILGRREGMNFFNVVCGAGEKIPFADNTFDIIICIRSLPYMDASITIPEMSRVLRIGGKIFLYTSTFGQFVRDFVGQPQHTPGIRERLRIVKHAINSISVTWTGKKIFGRRGNFTASYVFLTTRRLIQLMENAGLKVLAQPHMPQLKMASMSKIFIIERIW